MSKSFTIKKTDPQGLARLSNEIRLLWTEIEKLSVVKEVPVVSTKSVQEISILGNALSVDKFLDEQGNYTALDSIHISTVKSGADSNNTSQSTLISAASSAGGGGGSSATSYALSADTSVVTVANSKDTSQSILISKAQSVADAGGGISGYGNYLMTMGA
jgi:hypothetical protein